MIRYTSRKIIAAGVSLVVFTFVAFWLVELLIPGDFFTPFRLGMTADEVEALRVEFGLDQPLVVRWWRWLTGFMTGSLAATTTGFGVSGQLGEAFSRTVFVFALGLLIAYGVGQWLGRWTAWRRGRLADGVTLGSIGVSSLFPPFLGFLFITVLGLRLRPIRAFVLGDSRSTLWINAPYTEGQVFNRMSLSLVLAGLATAVAAWWMWRRFRKRLSPWGAALIVVLLSSVSWVMLGITRWATDLLFDSALALGAFVVLAFGEFLLIMQSGMAATLYDDYIPTARAKGLREKTIRDRHAARNASLAVVARLAVSVPYLLTGLVIIERAVGFRGVGVFLFAAIESQDIPLAVSTLAVIGAITMAVRLILDIALAALDPRITRSKEMS